MERLPANSGNAHILIRLSLTWRNSPPKNFNLLTIYLHLGWAESEYISSKCYFWVNYSFKTSTVKTRCPTWHLQSNVGVYTKHFQWNVHIKNWPRALQCIPSEARRCFWVTPQGEKSLVKLFFLPNETLNKTFILWTMYRNWGVKILARDELLHYKTR